MGVSKVRRSSVPRATLGRLPAYLGFLKSLPEDSGTHISATQIARGLGYGEVMVRKDLNSVSGAGKPKVGYVTEDLIEIIEEHLGLQEKSPAILVGAGKLGLALYEYSGFADYGLDIVAAFDTDEGKFGQRPSGKMILPMARLYDFCRARNIKIGIITVPRSSAQEVCDELIRSGVTAIWSFAPKKLSVPDNVMIKYEDLALSLAHINQQVNPSQNQS
jgi:redox-sensing transcriptional repressor